MENLKEMPAWYGALWAVLGIVLVLAGYRMMRLFARLASGLLFAAVGLLAAAHFHMGPWASLGIAAVLGIVGLLAGNAYYFVNVAVNGAAAGCVLAGAVACAVLGKVHPAASIIGAVLGGILAVLFERPIGIFGTSLVGGALLVVGLAAVLASAGLAASSWLGLFYGVLLLAATVGGCAIQARAARDLPRKGAGDEASRGRQ